MSPWKGESAKRDGAFYLWTKKERNAAFGSRGTTNGTGVFTYKTHLLNNPDLREIDHTLGIWIIDFDDEWVTYIRWMCGFTQTEVLLTHQKSVYLSLHTIYFNIVYIYIYYRYISIYLHFSQCFDFMILYMLWMCSRTRTHDSSSRKAILIWLSSSSWFHGWMVLGCFPHDSREFHVLEPAGLVSLSADMHPRKGKLKVTF